jgi:DNA repair protein RecO (recombination protein O)
MKPGPAQSQAFLLRSANYSDADQVLTLYTRDFGKISCLAKGSRKSTKRYGAALRPFCRFEAMLRIPTGQGLAFLDSVEEQLPFLKLLSDLDALASGWRILELMDRLEEPGSAHPELFDALQDGLEALNKGGGEHAALRCEASLLRLNGWAPRLDACVQCLKPWPFRPSKFSLTEGGFLCADCRVQGAWLALKETEARALRSVFEAEDGLSALEARAALNGFIQHQLGRAMRTDLKGKSLRGLS